MNCKTVHIVSDERQLRGRGGRDRHRVAKQMPSNPHNLIFAGKLACAIEVHDRDWPTMAAGVTGYLVECCSDGHIPLGWSRGCGLSGSSRPCGGGQSRADSRHGVCESHIDQ